ncbi:hypothetical protein Bca52824_044305 [Brassica carinata]|uniref:Uncharacterized protein n=1 Tax=Brassica carinata TaxID=52824 RepID=A0A8X7V2W1_BRACI|nr:hypothetical protein Bca52824_044305 [Brassica carinata]
MDPNQTTGTTSSGINDVDPIGSDSGAGVTPTGQDRSLPINQTMVPERTGARVWNHPRDRSSSDDLTRSQSRPISPTHLAQTRGELTELREMMTTLIDEIPRRRPTPKALDCLALQRSQAPDPDATQEKIRNDPRGARNTNLTTKPLYPRESNPSATKTFHQAGFDNPSEQARRHDLRGPVDIDPQREDLGILNETGTFQNYIERNDAELKRIHVIVHMVTSSTPDIDMVIEETRTTPFTNIIASPLRAYINKFREMKANISHPNEVVALVALKNGVWFSSKFRKELAVRAPNSLHDALHRASYFATHKEEVATLKEQYNADKNNATKKPATPKEPTTKGQHSYAINNSTQKSSTYDLSKYCAFQDRKGHSTEECRAALCNQNKNKKTNEEVGEEEEPVTPKSIRKAKATTNKRGREVEHESPNSSPPAPKKRVYMISWEQNSNATDEIKNQTKGKFCFEISLVIRALENPDEVTPPPLHHSIQPKNKTS